MAVESVPTIDPADHEKAVERMQEASERWRSHGFDLDFANLVYLGDRNEAAGYLADHGWQLDRQSVQELLAANGLPPLDEDDEDVGQLRRTAIREWHTRQMSRDGQRQLGPGVQRRHDRHDGGGGARGGSREDDPLFDDPFAEPLVRAVGLDFFTRLVDGDDRADGRR